MRGETARSLPVRVRYPRRAPDPCLEPLCCRKRPPRLCQVRSHLHTRQATRASVNRVLTQAMLRHEVGSVNSVCLTRQQQPHCEKPLFHIVRCMCSGQCCTLSWVSEMLTCS